MAELCDICVLPLVRMEEGGTRCNHCWEVTSRLKTFLGAPAARKLVAATLAEIGCAPPACAACSSAVRLAEAHRDEMRGPVDDLYAEQASMRLAEQSYEETRTQHARDCPNQERP